MTYNIYHFGEEEEAEVQRIVLKTLQEEVEAEAVVLFNKLTLK